MLDRIHAPKQLCGPYAVHDEQYYSVRRLQRLDGRMTLL